MMKKLIAIAIMALATVVSGAENHNYGSDNGYYRAGEFSIRGFAYSQTEDDESIDHHRAGGGLSLNFFPHLNFGVGLDLSTPDIDSDVLEDVAWSVIYRLPIQQFAPYVRGGASYDASDWGEISAFGGAGLEYRFTKHLGVFVDSAYVSDLDGNGHFLSRAGFGFTF